MTYLRIAFAAVPVLAATPALAHTGIDHTHGFFHGLAHPVGGVDHVLAMVAVGLFASWLGNRALWAVPAAFVMMMLAGGAFGIAGVQIPAVELGISLSIVIIGAVTALGLRWPVAAAMALVGFFAIFHGYAHGAEMPLGGGALDYSLAFALTTSLLHATGIAAGFLTKQPLVVRISGAVAAVWGVVLLVG